MNINELVGANIRTARENASLKQEELANLIGLSRVSVVNIEAGKQQVNVGMLYRLCLALNVPMETFLPDEHKMAVDVLGNDVVELLLEKNKDPERLRKMLIGFLI